MERPIPDVDLSVQANPYSVSPQASYRRAAEWDRGWRQDEGVLPAPVFNSDVLLMFLDSLDEAQARISELEGERDEARRGVEQQRTNAEGWAERAQAAEKALADQGGRAVPPEPPHDVLVRDRRGCVWSHGKCRCCWLSRNGGPPFSWSRLNQEHGPVTVFRPDTEDGASEETD